VTSSNDFLQSLVNFSEVTSVSSQFDIFMLWHIQTAVLATVETVYKSLAPVEQNHLEFLVPRDTDTYIDLDIKLYVPGKMISMSGKDVDLTDTTAVDNNVLHSLFSNVQSCLTESLSPNRTSIIIIVPILIHS
jgi:hypothetical protein